MPRAREPAAPDLPSDSSDDETIFRGLYIGLRRFAASVGPDQIEPDDLVQEAVARTLRHHRLADLENAEAYLRQAIVSVASTSVRRESAWRSARLRLAAPGVESQPVPSDLADLARLAPIDRAVMWLVHVEGHTHREAAALLGVSEQASRTRASRARQQLKRCIVAEEAHR
jgi:DNA-directed RNA polymerase specialized sigma24 family protein